MKIKNRKNLIFLIPILLILIGFSFTGLNLASFYDGGSGDARYNEITIDNTGGSALIAYQQEIMVQYNENMQSDFDDIRFTEVDGTVLKHFKKSYTSSASATFLVQIDCDADSSKTILMHHGNPDLTDVSDTTIFPFYDDFNDGTYTDKWDIVDIDGAGTATITETSGYLDLYATCPNVGTSPSIEAWSKITIPAGNYIIEGESRASSTNEYKTRQIMSVALFDSTKSTRGAYGAIDLQNTNTIVVSDGTTSSHTTSVAYNNFAPMSLIYTPTIVQYTYNGDFIADNTPQMQVYDNEMYIRLRNSYTNGQSGNCHAYYDWILARQYLENPPTVTIGSLFDTDGNEFIPYHIDSITNDVTFPITLEASETITKYIAKPDGESPNADEVYPFYEDFSGSSLNANKWDTSGSPTISVADGTLTISANSVESIKSKLTFGNGYTIITKHRATQHDTTHSGMDIGFGQYIYPTSTNCFVIRPSTFSSPTYCSIVQDGNGRTIGIQGVDDTNFHISKLVRESDENIYIRDDVTIDTLTTNLPSGNLPIQIGIGTYANVQNSEIDYIYAIKNTNATDPTVSITNYGSYYKIEITNNEAYKLTKHLITIEDTELDISTTTDSLLISDSCPILVSEESLSTNNTTSGNDIDLSITFNNSIVDAKATITKPDNSTQLVNLTNSEGNIWIGTLSFTDVGNHSVTNYKINSESETIDSTLEFEILAASESETSTVQSSGGGSSYTPPVIEETNNESIDNIITENSEQLDKEEIVDILNDDTQAYLILFTLIAVGFLSFAVYRNRK